MGSKRRTLNLQEKFDVIRAVESGMKNKDVSQKYGIPSSTVSTILKNRDYIIKTLLSVGGERKRSKTLKYHKIEEAVSNWVQVVHSMNMPVTGPLIKEKAIEYATEFGISDFHASSGWLDRFKKRNSLQDRIKWSGNSVNSISEYSLHQDLKTLIREYDPDNVYKMEVTGIFFKCLPNETLGFKDSSCLDGNLSGDRVTVVACANMTGKEKLKLLVIGESNQPKCFKGAKSLEVDYDFDERSWMTQDIFGKWVINFDKKMVKQRRKVLLCVINCPAYSVEQKLMNVRLVFPSNENQLQYMDQDIVTNLKLYYRKRILQHLVMALENGESTENLVNLSLCISTFAKVWDNDISSSFIRNSFSKAMSNFENSVENLETVECDQSHLKSTEEIWKHLVSLKYINPGIKFEQYLYVDQNLAVADNLDELKEYDNEDSEQLRPAIECEQYLYEDGNLVESCNTDQELNNHDTEEPSRKEIMEALQTIRHGLRYISNVPEEIYSSINKTEHYFETALSTE